MPVAEPCIDTSDVGSQSGSLPSAGGENIYFDRGRPSFGMDGWMRGEEGCSGGGILFASFPCWDEERGSMGLFLFTSWLFWVMRFTGIPQ